MPYAVRFHDVDHGNSGVVKAGVLGQFVTKKIANNAARDHFAEWQDDFCDYMDCDIGEVFHEEYIDGMIDINALTPEGLTMRAWVERSTNSMKKRKVDGAMSHEYLVRSEDVDYRNPHGPGQYNVQANTEGPFDTLDDANEAARAHFRNHHCTSETGEVVAVRDYVEDKTPEGMLSIAGVVADTNMRAWVEARPARVKAARPTSVLSSGATECPFCQRTADSFPTGLNGLSRHVRLCPSKGTRVGIHHQQIQQQQHPHPHLHQQHQHQHQHHHQHTDHVHMPVMHPGEPEVPPPQDLSAVPPHDEATHDFPPPLTNYLMNAAATLEASPAAVPTQLMQPPSLQ